MSNEAKEKSSLFSCSVFKSFKYVKEILSILLSNGKGMRRSAGSPSHHRAEAPEIISTNSMVILACLALLY